MEINGKAIAAYFILYAKSIYSKIPPFLYILLLLIAAVGIVLIFSSQRVKSKWRVLSRLVFFEYVAFILCMTLFFRGSREHRAFNLTPFWSYTVGSEDLQYLLYVENLMNILMFLPIGLLLGCAYKSVGWKMMLVATLCLSFFIEVSQFIFKQGFAEFDDVMHNLLGAILGLGLYVAVATIVKLLPCKKKQYDNQGNTGVNVHFSARSPEN